MPFLVHDDISSDTERRAVPLQETASCLSFFIFHFSSFLDQINHRVQLAAATALQT